jgi:predicted heme/steroid binding protein
MDQYFSNSRILLNFVNMKIDMPIFTKSQLALRNGQDRNEIWCAYNGNIYDLSNSRLWRAGKHHEHWAGQDLTDELVDAPHSASVFDRFEVVGFLNS